MWFCDQICVVLILSVVLLSVQGKHKHKSRKKDEVDPVTEAHSECQQALGMESGDISDSQLSASSEGQWTSGEVINVMSASNGRLNNPYFPRCWQPSTMDVNQWFQVHLGEQYINVTRIATQGCGVGTNQWVTSYKLQYGEDGVSFQYRTEQEQSTEQVFSGNRDNSAVVANDIVPPIMAKFIRFQPVTWTPAGIGLRMELYGCKACADALGMESGSITDGQITASSERDSNYAPSLARLNNVAVGDKAGSWSAQTNDVNPWLQIELGNEYTKVTRIATQGRSDSAEWVESYKLQYSVDGVNYQYYREEGETDNKVFSGNSDQNTVVTQYLNPPITAPYIRVRPLTWNSNHISMRVELYGCPAVSPDNPYRWKHCVFRKMTNIRDLPNPSIPPRTWSQTPLIEETSAGHYSARGRILYADYLKEQLTTQAQLNFDTERETINLVEQLDILADVLYIEGVVEFSGIETVNIFARKIFASADSKIVVSTPNWIQEYVHPSTAGTAETPGSNGEHGRNGFDGPQVDIYCNILGGNFIVQSRGADGHKGQNGGSGGRGVNGQEGRSRSSSECADNCSGARKRRSPSRNSRDFIMDGYRGTDGTPGTNGGNAGHPGSGGNAGHINVRYGMHRGQVMLKSCAGSGALPAINGPGGAGGRGGRGGTGVKCHLQRSPCLAGYCDSCSFLETTGRASSGSPGNNGNPGSTPNSKGSNGQVSTTLVLFGELNEASRQRFPTELLHTIKRQAEDVLLGDSNDRDGIDALQFIREVAPETTDIGREVRRKIRFLESGHDILGYNKLFSSRTPWEELITAAESYKVDANSYEDAFNEIISTAEQSTQLNQLTERLSQLSTTTLEAEIVRLQEAVRVSTAEKGLRFQAVRELERRMESIFTYIGEELPKVYDKATFNPSDGIAILQGLVGFASAGWNADPTAAAGAIVGIIESQAHKQCLQTMESYLANAERWLTFGTNYKAFAQSSDLDFDTLDVKELPEMMKVDLEMNKETFVAEFVCLLGVASREQDVATFKGQIESFFIVGGYRIDLIARLLELDNEIGGLQFDIQVLQDTKRRITDLTNQPPDTPITTELRKTFTDRLLRAYSELEEMFLRKLSKLLKALEFHTLWEANNPFCSFRRTATESAYGTGRLNGEVQLTTLYTDALNYFLERGSECLLDVRSTYAVWKYSFDNSANENKRMFDELVSYGQTNFTINIQGSCRTCYNARLLKIYIEFFGTEDQPDSVPRFIKYKFRHHGWSYFRTGDGSIKQYRQKEQIYTDGRFVNVYESHLFNRFTTSDAAKCEANGHTGVFCGVEDGNDNRLKSLCDDPTTRLASETRRLHIEAECKSPFGTYDLRIPVDTNLQCSDTTNSNNNCKDLDLTKFTNINVWAYVLYWDERYPLSPDDPMCNTNRRKKDQASVAAE